jgi:aspartate 1-decarboxylase
MIPSHWESIAVLVSMLKSKLHCARVTACDRDYEGSLMIDRDLMDMVRIVPYERILVADVENGGRLETYAIPGPRGSRTVGLNGAAAHLGAVGDRLIVLAFCLVEAERTQSHHPLVVVLDAENRPVGGIKAL